MRASLQLLEGDLVSRLQWSMVLIEQCEASAPRAMTAQVNEEVQYVTQSVVKT